jgi:hypothetical protein
MPAADDRKLAAALVECLQPLIPDDVTIALHDNLIHLGERDSPRHPYFVELAVGWPGGVHHMNADDPLCATVELFLDNLQTELAEHTTEPWPKTAPAPWPEPFAVMHGDQVVFGYGDEDLGRIPLATIAA